MKNNTKKSVVLTTLLSFLGFGMMAQASVILMQDDFDSGSTPTLIPRVYASVLDNGWHKTSAYASHINSAWDISGGTLNNPTADTVSYVQSETPVFNWFTNPLPFGYFDVLLSFDVPELGAGDTVTAHLWAVQEDTAAPDDGPGGAENFITNNQGWINNTSHQNQTLTTDMGGTGYRPYNVANGSNPPAGSSTITGVISSTGTFTGIFNVSELGIPGVNYVSDIDTFFIAFAMNEVGGGITSIDNLVIKAYYAPEPSTLGLIIMGAGLLYNRRRKFARN